MPVFTYATPDSWGGAAPINSFLMNKIRSAKRSYKHKLAKNKGKK